MKQRSGPRGRAAGFALLTAATVFGACTQQVMVPGPLATVGPQLSVERFLQAASQRDLAGMSRLFGTAEGPIGDTGSTFGCFFKKIGSWFGGLPCVTRQEVELRMATIADILRHQDYVIRDTNQVPGRNHPTMRVLVDLTVDGNVVRGVPFDVVDTGSGTWLVERVDLERVMSGR